MDSLLTDFSPSHSIEPPALSLSFLNYVSTIQRPPTTCVTFETTINKGVTHQFKNVNFWCFRHRQFLDVVRWRWTHQFYHLAMVTLVISLHSQWHCNCLKMPLLVSPTLLRLERSLKPLTKVRSVSAVWQSTAGCWTDINSAFKRSWSGAYDALNKTYFKLNNYLTTEKYKWPPGSGTLLLPVTSLNDSLRINGA